MPHDILLISHHLCPYVQRSAIVAAEKGIPFDRQFTDLVAKPEWFLKLSPTGKVPLLKVTDETGRDHILFESAAIAEYLDETGEGERLMPDDPVARARTRAWVEFASGALSDIAGFYSAADEETFNQKQDALTKRFGQVELVSAGPWFGGEKFGLVDAAFGPVFRYLDAFELLAGIYVLGELPRIEAWRTSLAKRPSVAGAVSPDFPARLQTFLTSRQSHLANLISLEARPVEAIPA